MSLPEIIDSNQKLKKWYSKLNSAKNIALDTEFLWEKTYYPILGIIQVGMPNGDSTIIDVLSIDNLSPLADIIENKKIQKILHDSTQDLTIIHQACGALPKNVFDTQKAAGFAGLGSSISLVNLLSKTVQINLPKTETRTNWIKRPLSKKQINYALDDVRYLCKMKEKILNRISNKTIIKWLMEEMTSLDSKDLYIEKAASLAYLRIRGQRKLKHNEMTLLRALAQWREEKARLKNLPREHIVNDKQLIALAKLKHISEKSIKENNKLFDHKIKSNLDEIVEIFCQDLPVIKNYNPPKNIGKRANDKFSALADLAISIVKSKSLENKIDPALVYNRSTIETMIKEPDKHPPNGWRGEFIGHDLIDLIKGNRTVTINKQTGLPRI